MCAYRVWQAWGVSMSFAWELVMFLCSVCVLLMHILRRQCHSLVNHVHFGSSIHKGRKGHLHCRDRSHASRLYGAATQPAPQKKGLHARTPKGSTSSSSSGLGHTHGACRRWWQRGSLLGNDFDKRASTSATTFASPSVFLQTNELLSVARCDLPEVTGSASLQIWPSVKGSTCQ